MLTADSAEPKRPNSSIEKYAEQSEYCVRNREKQEGVLITGPPRSANATYRALGQRGDLTNDRQPDEDANG